MWDIFCSVVDNYGDVGVCWRLARTLVHEHRLPVRLWVDDLAAFARINPGADATAPMQVREGVEVRAWSAPFPAVAPGEVVVEGFGCPLPESYLAAMARQVPPPVWITLEYLTAEHWVSGYHRLPSPHPRLPLTKHFFFPGFDPGTGGLLRERGLADARDAYQGALPARDGLRISLFGYENPLLPALLDAWVAGPEPVTCLMPEGPALANRRAGDRIARGALSLEVLPFTDQPGYDRLLWSCDCNFTRGEDSFVRAQWAARPFVWHIYPQEGGAHIAKLEAFLVRYCAALEPAAADAVAGFMRAWNGALEASADIGADWRRMRVAWPALAAHSRAWAGRLARGPELAAELVNFAQRRVK